jgi:hypothetical protein
MRQLTALSMVCLLFAAACGTTAGPSEQQRIELAVAATVNSMPRPTSAPLPTPMPTFTPIPLSGVFCEYQFCIGHPSDMAFYDVSAAQNQASPSTYGQGILAAYKATAGPFIQVLWQESPGVTDPSFIIDLIMQNSGDTRTGSIQPLVVGNLNVFYTLITPTPGAVSTVPFGSAAAWICGGRAFAWKVYAPQQELAESLLADALARFRCESR